MPDVPTLVEAGYKGVALESWYAAFAPLGTPEPIIARLNAEMDKACADKATQDAMFKTATDAVGGSPAKLAAAARADFEKYARLVRELNIKLG
jgi:tripartite-type tricarboxylate transporter receptor subunit TctC